MKKSYMLRDGLFPMPASARSGRARRHASAVLEVLEERTLLSVSSTPGPIGSIPPLTAPVGAEGDWTVMVYITATDLAEYTVGNIIEMERAAAQLPESARIVVLYDQWANDDGEGNPKLEDGLKKWGEPGDLTFATGDGTQPKWDTAGVGLIAPRDPDRTDEQIATAFTISTAEVDTGDPQTLANFVHYASMLAPAKHYALIMWDHGDGVEGTNFDRFDMLKSNYMTTVGLAEALDAARENGVKLDMVAYDACLMATAEVVYALRDVTPVVVASEELIDGPGMDYEASLGILNENPGQVDARALARSFVDAYQGRGQYGDTLSALDTAGISSLAEALKTFVASTQDARRADWAAMIDAFKAAAAFAAGDDTPDGGPYRDLGQFMTQIVAAGASPPISAAARGVLSALGSVVFATTDDRRRTQGLSINLPGSGEDVTPGYLEQVADSGFEASTGWTSFQALMSRALARFEPGWADEVNWARNQFGPASALDLGVPTGASQRVPPLALGTRETAWFRLNTQADGRGARAILARVAQADGPGVLLRVFRATDIGRPVARGVDQVSLRGRPEGDYLVAATSVGGVRFGLAVRGPGPGALPDDKPVGNDSRGSAKDLGTVVSTRLFPGLGRSSSAGEAWFKFDTVRSVDPFEGAVAVITGGRPATIALYDEDGDLLSRARGSNGVRVVYEASGSAEPFYVAVGGAPSAYSLFFAPRG